MNDSGYFKVCHKLPLLGGVYAPSPHACFTFSGPETASLAHAQAREEARATGGWLAVWQRGGGRYAAYPAVPAVGESTFMGESVGADA